METPVEFPGDVNDLERDSEGVGEGRMDGGC